MMKITPPLKNQKKNKQTKKQKRNKDEQMHQNIKLFSILILIKTSHHVTGILLFTVVWGMMGRVI